MPKINNYHFHTIALLVMMVVVEEHFSVESLFSYRPHCGHNVIFSLTHTHRIRIQLEWISYTWVSIKEYFTLSIPVFFFCVHSSCYHCRCMFRWILLFLFCSVILRYVCVWRYVGHKLAFEMFGWAVVRALVGVIVLCMFNKYVCSNAMVFHVISTTKIRFIFKCKNLFIGNVFHQIHA